MTDESDGIVCAETASWEIYWKWAAFDYKCVQVFIWIYQQGLHSIKSLALHDTS